MLKIERRLIEFVEKHMCLLGALILSLLALYLRKIAVWCNYESIGAYFDMHENYIQTSVYFVLVRLVQFLPVLPVHSIKWLAGLADFGVAGLTVYMLGREVDDRKRLIFYTVSLFSPVLFLRGIIWAQLDSVAILLLLTGYAIYSSKQGKNKKIGMRIACVPVIFAVSLCPYLFPVVILYLWKKEKEQQEFWTHVLILVSGGVILQFLCTLLIGQSWMEGIFSGIRFLTYHQESGALFEDAGEWLLQLIYLYSAVAAVLTALAAGKHRISYGWTIVVQAVAVLLYGAKLFQVLP